MNPWTDSVLRMLSFAAMSTLLVASAAPAQAQVTDAEAKCRAAVVKGSARYVRALGKAIVACHVARDAGQVDAMVDCNDPEAADVGGKAARAAMLAAEAVAKSCAATPAVLSQFGRCPAPQQSLDDGGATTGIDTFTELLECLNAHGRDLVGKASSRSMGLPTPPLGEDIASCHAAIGKAFTRYIDGVIKARARCQKSIDKNGGALEFACATADPRGRIEKLRVAARDAVVSGCAAVSAISRERSARATRLPNFGACAEGIDEFLACAIDDAATTAGNGSASMMWELPGVCPDKAAYAVAPTTTGAQFDAGYTGAVHDMDPTLGFRAVNFPIACDPDCADCATVSPSPSSPPDACRCSEDASQSCTDNADCSGACNCFYGPPTAFAAHAAPLCVVNVLSGTMSGSFDVQSGDLDLTVPLLTRIHHGIEIGEPCPRCAAGVCEGGQRDGLACSADSDDTGFGSMSYDCPPGAGSNITGNGLSTVLSYSTGPLALPFATPCDAPLGAHDCACALCSTDESVACNTDSDCAGLPSKCSALYSDVECGDNADCAAADVGPCNTGTGRCGQSFSTVCASNSDCVGVNVGICEPAACNSYGNAPPRQPNSCNDLICTADGGDPTEGSCLAGPVDSYCDGLLRSNGDGIIACGTDADCDAYVSPTSDPSDWVCPGNDCGACSLVKNRDCFLDPVAAQGEPGVSVVGLGCLGATSTSGRNAGAGLPGAYRVRQNSETVPLCSDGVTPFIVPGGSNCP